MSDQNPYKAGRVERRTQLSKTEMRSPLLAAFGRVFTVFFVCLLFVPSGTKIAISDGGSPVRHVRFWWGYVPDSFLDAGFSYPARERVITVVTHCLASVLLSMLVLLVLRSVSRHLRHD